MAKQLINPVERHVEKAVLGLAILVLIAVFVRYLISPPNQIELSGEVVLPSTIDQKLLQKAGSVRERIIRAQLPDETVERLAEMLDKLRNPYQNAGLPLRLPMAVAIGPEVPLVDPPDAQAGDARIADMVPTGTPAITHGRSTYLYYDAEGEERRAEANWITISVLFDVKGQMAKHRSAYGAAWKDVIFGPTQLQRRERRDDGSWPDDGWVVVAPWSISPVELPEPPTITLIQEEGRATLPSEVESAVERFSDRLMKPEMQLDLLRPLMPDTANGTQWTFPIIAPVAYRDVLMMDDEYLYPNEAPASNPVDRYSEEEEGIQIEVEQVSPAERIRRLFDEADRLLNNAWKYKVENDAVNAWNIGQQISRMEEAGTGDKARAERLKERADQMAADIRRAVARGGYVKSAGIDEDAPKREPLPIQQIWVHDARPGSVQSGKTYQYRLRPSIFNPLAGDPDKFRNKVDATTVYLFGKWRESIEVTIERDTRFFVTSDKPRDQSVSIEFFKWFEGVWVKARRFAYKVGDVVEGECRCDVPNWDDPTVAENVLVQFTADASVLDIDFARTHRERKQSGRVGVKFNPRSTACCVVLTDSSGRLYERFVPTDRAHPDKRTVGNRVWKQPRKKD